MYCPFIFVETNFLAQIYLGVKFRSFVNFHFTSLREFVCIRFTEMQLKGGSGEKSELDLEDLEAAGFDTEDDANSSNDINDESGVRSEMAGVSSSCSHFLLHPPILLLLAALAAVAAADRLI